MTKSLAHRGPDDSGMKVFADGRVALGHTRLSILDLSPRGHQPMCDRQRRLWITYNGEIYNFREVRKHLRARGHRFTSNTDTEVVLYSYKEWGSDCLSRFNGMFAFAIWDDEKKLLFLARDRIGIKPLYYFHKNDLLIFASEIKAILRSGFVQRNIDYDALHTPSMYQAAPYTGFKEVYKLQPGNYLAFDGNRLAIQKYWQIDSSEAEMGEEGAVDELEHLLRLSVNGQMISDVPVGAFLSGGLDSSLVVALMSKNASQRVSTFTIK
ncbi:MAG: asparagine synthase (glutamine-hydrolyzing), partial [bacterium]